MTDKKSRTDSTFSTLVYDFDVPAALQDAPYGTVTSISVKELTPGDEILAAKRSGGDSSRIGFELAKLSLVRVNDDEVTTADESGDRAWRDIGPKLRNLVMAAYTGVNMAGEKDTLDFLKTRKRKVT